MKRTAQKVLENSLRSEEERKAFANEELKRRFRRRYVKECTPKEIRRQITELRQDKKLPQNKKDYRPNIKGIQHVFIENAAEVNAVVSNYELARYSSKPSNLKTYLNDDEIISNMLKEIILCDYNKQDYKLPEPKKPDYLGIMNY